MSTMPLMRIFLGLTAIAAVSGVSRAAVAQVCKADTDCPQSFTCVTSEISAEPAPSCPPDATDCKRAPTTMTPTVIKTCQPKACTADANCGPGMVCHTQMYQECSSSGSSDGTGVGGTAPSTGAALAPCPPNTECKPPERTPPNCTTKTVSACAFKWQLPCSTAADCGDGFNCKPSITGSCSGGTPGTGTGGGTNGSGGATPPSTGTGASPTAPADFAPRKPDADGGAPNCTTMESFPGYCEPKATTCDTDSQCPASWKCTSYDVPTASTRPATDPATPTTGTGGAAGGGSTGAPTPVSAPVPAADGGASKPAPTTVKACTSPYGSVRATDLAGSGGPGIPGATPSPIGSTNGEGTTPPTAPGGGKTASDPKPSAGGCSLVAAGTTSGAGALALVALLGLLVSRRRK